MTDTILRCFRSACSNAADPRGYHRVTHGLYCADCARRIESMRMRPDVSAPYFPMLDAMREPLPDGGSYEAGIVLTRSDR